MFNSIDESYITVSSGSGGDGSQHLKREKYNAKGGPDGGNGGKGGDVYIEASKNTSTLVFYTRSLHFKAENGDNGGRNNCTGKNGKDITLQVPIGTQIFDENEELLHDFTQPEKIKILIGGKGGAGNTNYKSATNQTPTKFKPGELGITKKIKMVLKTLADIGIIGKPNVGKSTLISHITNAKVKIGDYDFTTLYPNIGIVKIASQKYTICDIPGLIKNAHLGSGLGIRFLKHIERCKILLHLISPEYENPVDSYLTIHNELKSYSEELIQKKEIICITKAESINNKTEIINKFKNNLNKDVIFISSHENTGISKMLQACHISLSNL